MCSYQTLFHENKCGYVIRCVGCANIQVTFGNFIITFAKPDFNQFVQMVKKLRDQHEHSADTSAKTIIVPTPCEGMRLLFIYRELNDLDIMLDAADSELQTLELIDLFGDNGNK